MKRHDAFTLVELLIALAITAILVVLLANVVSATLNVWRQGRTRLDTYSNARQLIGRMSDEIGGAVAATNRMAFVENDASLSTAKPGTSENVFFVAPYPNSGAGDLCVFMYRHDDANHRLERRFKDSATAWSITPTNRYKVGNYPDSTPTEWRAVADGVMEFEIRSYSQDDLDNNKTPQKTWNSQAVGDVNMEGKTPRRIVLRVKVVDDRTLAHVTSLTPTALAAAAREFFAEFSLPSR